MGLTYPDTSVLRLTVRITEFPDKWVTFCWGMGIGSQTFVRISEAQLYVQFSNSHNPKEWEFDTNHPKIPWRHGKVSFLTGACGLATTSYLSNLDICFREGLSTSACVISSVLQWTLTYPDTSVSKWTVWITEYPNKCVLSIYTIINGSQTKIVRISE